MPAHFEKEIQLRFRQADPAGILFFGHVFDLAHDCFEDFIQAVGMSWNDWFQTQNYLVPIRQTECQFLKPLFAGQNCNLRASVARIGDSSFQMRYGFYSDSTLCAEVLMVHTFLDAKSHQKISVPLSVRDRFAPYLELSNEK